MTALRSALAVVATLTVLGLFAGAGAAAPVDGATDQPEAQVGPPGGLPGPVPDFVGNLLDVIGQFLNGILDGALGPAASDEAAGGPGAGTGDAGGPTSG